MDPNEILAALPKELHQKSGRVFYSGRSAFSTPSSLYILGLNPGGSPSDQAHETIESDVASARTDRPANWSAYIDESWAGKKPGTKPLQKRMQYLAMRLGQDLRSIPASNLVFVRSARESDIKYDFKQLANGTWPVHQEIIRNLDIAVIVCLGNLSLIHI